MVFLLTVMIAISYAEEPPADEPEYSWAPADSSAVYVSPESMEAIIETVRARIEASRDYGKSEYDGTGPESEYDGHVTVYVEPR